MRNYNCTTETIILNDKEMKAHYPKTHSTVKGIVYSYKRWDQNAGDPWANIKSMKEYIVLYILWKGYMEWGEIVDGSKNTSSYTLCSYCNRYC